MSCRIWTLLEELIADEHLSLSVPSGISNTSLVDVNSLLSESDGEKEEGGHGGSPRRRSLSHDISVSNLLLYSPLAKGTETAVPGEPKSRVGGSAEDRSAITALTNRIKDLEMENALLRKQLSSVGLTSV